MKLLNDVTLKPGTITSATNGTKVPADVAGALALNLSVQINFTGSSESASTAQLFKSNDGTNWIADGSTQSITGASGTVWLEKQNNTALYWRVQYACGGGSFVPTEIWNLMG